MIAGRNRQRRAELGYGLEAIAPLQLERTIQRVAGFARDFRPQQTSGRKRERRLLARIAARQQMVQRGCERVHIRLHRRNALVLLRRRVARRADHRAALARLQQLGNPEIHDLDLTIALDHHIGRLHIAIDQAMIVQ